MHTDVRESGPFERMLTLRITEEELEPAKDKAARKLSRQVKIKGFRPGKAPRAIVERMVGVDGVRAEAIDDAMPDLVTSAIDESGLEPVITPAVTEIQDVDDGVEIEVRVTLWPTVDAVPEFAREVEVDPPEVSDEELDAQIDRIRSQYAELEDVTRAADDGDFVTVNLSATADGIPVEEVAVTDLLYEVGSRSYIPGLDELLIGSSAGDIREGDVTLPDGFGDHAGSTVVLRALVKGVKTRRLPELDDEFVSDISEYETAAELVEATRARLLAFKLQAVRGLFRDRLLDGLVEDLGLDLPEALVQAEVDESVHNMAHSLERQGIDLATYLSVTGQDVDAFTADLRSGAVRSLSVRILLEGVARIEGIEVEDDEIDAAVAEMTVSTRRDPAEVRRIIEDSGQIKVLSGDILRRKALDHVLASASAVDADGNAVDLTIEVEESDQDNDDDIDDIYDEVEDGAEEEAPVEGAAGPDPGDTETIEDGADATVTPDQPDQEHEDV